MSRPVNDSRVVRYCPEFGLSTLFCPLQRGPRPGLDVTYIPESGCSKLVFACKAALGMPEQTLLLALLELAQDRLAADPAGSRLDSSVRGLFAQQLWFNLHKSLPNSKNATVYFTTSWNELCRRCGCEVGGTSKAMRLVQLQRLCEVTVWEYDGTSVEPTRQSSLVAWLNGNDSGVLLALNHRLASALFGDRYAQVSMTERAALKGDAVKAMHVALSTMLRSGHGLRIGVRTLAARLWPGGSVATPEGTVRRRLSDVRRGLADIGALTGWSVEPESEAIYRVMRATLPSIERVREMTSPGHVTAEAMSNRKRPEPRKASTGAAFGAGDVSGLFSTTSS